MRPTSKTRNALLWTIQVLLAVLFLFAGGFKLAAARSNARHAIAGFAGVFPQVHRCLRSRRRTRPHFAGTVQDSQ